LETINGDDYLLSKKEWIVKNKEEDNSSFWIDFSTLACCVYAKNRKLDVNLESEYIPRWVYEENWEDSKNIY